MLRWHNRGSIWWITASCGAAVGQRTGINCSHKAQASAFCSWRVPLQYEYLLAGAREAEGGVTELALAWVRADSSIHMLTQRYVWFCRFPDAEERSDTCQAVRTKVASASRS